MTLRCYYALVETRPVWAHIPKVTWVMAVEDEPTVPQSCAPFTGWVVSSAPERNSSSRKNIANIILCTKPRVLPPSSAGFDDPRGNPLMGTIYLPNSSLNTSLKLSIYVLRLSVTGNDDIP